ncbi:MAG: hypothetical protein K8I82_23240, partial [Anaerolineae bacterium]|nr:hypothetical protein [Anaerolineae bacterium]
GTFIAVDDVFINPADEVTYTLSENATINGELRINDGIFNLNNNTLNVSDSLIVSSSTLLVNKSSILEASTHIGIKSDAYLNFVGNADSTATITQGSSTYTFQIEGGVSARYYSLEFTENGVVLESTASINTINNFSDGSFSNGAGAEYINYIAETGSVIDRDSIKNVVFGVGPTNNVRRTAGVDTLFFYDSTGAFTGNAYEVDDGGAATGRIQWSRSGAVWIGGVGNWKNPANWNLSQLPKANENVTVLNSTDTITIDSIALGNNLNLDDGAIIITGSGSLDLEGDMTINGEFTVNNSDSVEIGGSLDISGIFNIGTAVLLFDANGGSQNINFNGNSIANIVFDGSGATWVLQGALDINGDLTILNGSLDVSSNNYSINIDGNWSNNGNLLFNNGLVIFD